MSIAKSPYPLGVPSTPAPVPRQPPRSCVPLYVSLYCFRMSGKNRTGSFSAVHQWAPTASSLPLFLPVPTVQLGTWCILASTSHDLILCIARICCNLLIHLPVGRHLNCSQFLSIMDKVGIVGMRLFCFVFKTGLLCIILAVLELSMWTSLASNSQRSSCICLPSAGTKDMHHHTWPFLFSYLVLGMESRT